MFSISELLLRSQTHQSGSILYLSFNSFEVASKSLLVREHIATLHPSEAKPSATALPIPLLDAVMRAVFPFKPNCIFTS